MPVSNVHNQKLNEPLLQEHKIPEKSGSYDQIKPIKSLDQYTSTIISQNDRFLTQNFEENSTYKTNRLDYTKLCNDTILEHKFSALIQTYQTIPVDSSHLFLSNLEEKFKNCLLQQDQWAASDLIQLGDEIATQLCDFPELEQTILRTLSSVFVEYDEPEELEKIEQKILYLEEKIAQERIEKAAYLLSCIPLPSLIQISEQSREPQYETICKEIVSNQNFAPLIQIYQETSSDPVSLDEIATQFTKYLQVHDELTISDLMIFKDIMAEKLNAFPQLEKVLLKAMLPIFMEDDPEEVDTIETRLFFLQEQTTQENLEKAISLSSATLSSVPQNSSKIKKNSLSNTIFDSRFTDLIEKYEKTPLSSLRKFLARLEVELARSVMQNEALTISDLLSLEKNITSNLDQFPELERAALKGISPAFIRTEEKEQNKIAQKILSLDEKIVKKLSEKIQPISAFSKWEMMKTIGKTSYAVGKWLCPVINRKDTFLCGVSVLIGHQFSVSPTYTAAIGVATAVFAFNFSPFNRWFTYQSINII